jgi:hypothetical protein
VKQHLSNEKQRKYQEAVVQNSIMEEKRMEIKTQRENARAAVEDSKWSRY